MPKRPPRGWMRDCVEGVEKRGSATNPGAVCGSLWYNKMSEEERQEATKRHEKPRRRRK